jgi:hypothetical protein
MRDLLCILIVPGFFAATGVFLWVLVRLQEGGRP